MFHHASFRLCFPSLDLVIILDELDKTIMHCKLQKIK